MRGAAAACLLFFLMTTAGAQSPTALCDGIVAQVRANASSPDPFDTLYKGDQPSIEYARLEMQSAGFTEKAEFVNRFLTRFNPSDALRRAWMDFTELPSVEVLSLPDSDAHVATSTGGTALCVTFLFFQRVGLQSELLPELPRKGERDGDNLICSNYGSAGYLARIGETEAFLETYSQDYEQQLRVVPLRNRRWGAACTVDAEFRTEYTVSKVFVPADGPIAEADLRAVAAQFVERPGVATREQPSKIEQEPVPTFGRENQLEPGEEFLRYGESYPVVFSGRSYLMRVGRGQLGCCVETDPALIVYTLKDGTLEPVASAIVARKRGGLQSLRAVPSR